MKRPLLNHRGRIPGWTAAQAILSALLLAAPGLHANPSVQTLTGGPSAGYVNGNTFAQATFNFPCDLAVNASDTVMFVADRNNNAIREIMDLGNANTSQTLTFAGSANGIDHPVAVAVDGATNVYVLNRGNGSNGCVLRFDGRYYVAYSSTLLATNLPNATALALDGLTNLYVTVNSNTVLRITPAGVTTVVGVIPEAGTSLRGVTVLDNGQLALTDAGNNGIWLLNPRTGAASQLTGFNGAGDDDTSLGLTVPKQLARFNDPEKIAKADGDKLVVADCGNQKVKIVDAASGDVTRLYGVNPAYWVTGSTQDGIYPGWWDGTVCSVDALGCPEAREPVGVVVAHDGSVYASEDYYHIIRHITNTGLTDNDGLGTAPYFAGVAGVALDGANDLLYVADPANDSVELLNLADNQTTTFLDASNGLAQPVDVRVDADDNIYVLNQGNAANGSILEFDRFGNLLGTKATGLSWPTSLALDASGNLFVAERNGTVEEFGQDVSNSIAVVAQPGVQLNGIALFDDGTIAVSDAGNQVIWQINPATKAVSVLTGQLGTPGATLGAARFAQLNQPQQLASAAGNLLVVADAGNNRLVTVNRSGAITNVLDSTNATVWFGQPGDPVASSDSRFVPMVSPVGVALGSGGSVYASEAVYDDVRGLLNTGLVQPGTGSTGGGSSTNVVVMSPSISPDSGYYPMGQLIMVSSPYSNVCYTVDGSDPTTNSPKVSMSGNVGFIHWANTTNDLSALRVRAFLGTNASAVVSGQAVRTNTVGVPADSTGSIYAGVGSSIVVPVVANLQAGVQVKSYQFRVEVTPNGAAPAVAGLESLSFGVNNLNFIPLKSPAVAGQIATYGAVRYTIGSTVGLEIMAIGTNANVSFENDAVVALLEINLPANAPEGSSYSLSVSYPSATSDGGNVAVPLAAMPPATLLVTNVAYTVGDSASPNGTWYNAGGFGNNDLDNADVNNAFYASLGLRVPYTFSDVFNAMDVYPEDAPGFVGGDGQIRYLDWQFLLRRSLRLDTNNWARAWSTNGMLVDITTNLTLASAPQARARTQTSVASAPWYRPALVGATSVGNAAPGSRVSLPVYVTLQDGATLGGLEFRARVVPQGAAPALTQNVQFIPALGIPTPQTVSLESAAIGCGWPLVPNASFDFQPLSSNYLGAVTFTIPASAQAGQVYALTLTNADGGPDLSTEYNFETRSAEVAVEAPVKPASASSDDWKMHFFGSTTNSLAADQADPDHDGVPNWAEYLAGTDPLNPKSNLHFSAEHLQTVNGKARMELQWLTAPGKAYQVQWSPALTGGKWTTVATVAGDGSVASCTDTNGMGAAGYYRLVVVP